MLVRRGECNLTTVQCECALEAEAATEEALVDEDYDDARAEVEAEVQRGGAVHAVCRVRAPASRPLSWRVPSIRAARQTIPHSLTVGNS